MKEYILKIGVNKESEDIIIDRLLEFMYRKDKQRVITCANPHSIILARKDQVLYNSLNESDFCLPDGTGVVLASKILNGDIKRRICGPDFFEKLNNISNNMKEEVKYFFLGSTEETLKMIKQKMNILYPNIKVVGIYSPPFGAWPAEINNQIIAMINNSSANVLWVGLGSPKQEKWIYENISKLNVNVVAAIGAAFDFFAQTKRRTPRILGDLGLEWFFRFLMEPVRLWKRNIISMPTFVYLVFKERCFAKN